MQVRSSCVIDYLKQQRLVASQTRVNWVDNCACLYAHSAWICYCG